MNRAVLIMMSCMAAALVGCSSPGSHKSRCNRPEAIKRGPPSVHVVGIVSKSSAGDRYAFADLGRSTFDMKRLVYRAGPHKKFETDQVLKIEIVQQSPRALHAYSVLLGPELNSTKKASGILLNSEPTFYLQKGTAFLAGEYVLAKTPWVSAGAEGTSIVLEIVDEAKQRVYLLKENDESAYVDLTCKGANKSTARITYGEKGRYVEIGKNCTVSAEMDIDGDPVAQPFIDTWKKIAEEAGWTPPP